ncbi:helix-turn-helix domain-containing protein [Coraliomargarita sp. SDUM461003]|uniref:Helix-turn-helix domain-containing protein n=1 Tax=Thalassobacterium maritimum TaxID=3041265 RepID=A0ABU1AUQ7_9BACT|nr:helix-turn-helix domain-containing protein [Coraliomargarita sp. SDUM461003]MDQ8207377.1 helix-turn-helix domain-containing protein [Coraliomargarita sp. SDUM461003]
MSKGTMEETVQISEQDRQLLEKLNEVINGNERPVLLGREGAHIHFPEPVFHHLTHIVRAMLQGQSVSVLAENEEFTTQAAANFLGVSRPHLVKVLEAGTIPFHRVGSHRRVSLSDLRQYQKLRDGERRQSLDALTKRVETAGYYDSDYTGD